LGDELRRLRLARGLSIRELAQAAGLPHMTYMGYEQGKAVPPVPRREALARALGIPPPKLDELVEEDEYEVFLRSRPLSPEGREAVRQFLRSVRRKEQGTGNEEQGQGSEGRDVTPGPFPEREGGREGRGE